ncbi:hypothetical protein K466DRAFT_587871 [Polyporus arcularius HHB13444]|uniref:Uncharacterized protein n=1 Tax=Polyporus arcularius HHB13444 TaxID=1314778 RepID=A0A5C3P9W9_9APHY|nr:hypothetical protein K466DRAFT_587871 [Polyporus arcularius HHB13444]
MTVLQRLERIVAPATILRLRCCGVLTFFAPGSFLETWGNWCACWSLRVQVETSRIQACREYAPPQATIAVTLSASSVLRIRVSNRSSTTLVL